MQILRQYPSGPFPRHHYATDHLYEAAAEGDAQGVKHALANGAFHHVLLPFRDFKRTFPLHLAKTTKVARILIAAGADVKAREGNPILQGPQPLHRARSVGIARLLLDAGAPVSAPTISGDTPLHFQAKVGAASIVRLLLERGADVNSKNSRGECALSLAKNVCTARLLIQAGADVNAVDRRGRHVLFATSDFAVVKVLLEHGADPAARLHGSNLLGSWCARTNAPWKNMTRIVGILLRAGVDANGTSEPGSNSALHHATEQLSVGAVRLLLEAGVDPNVRGRQGLTPLQSIPPHRQSLRKARMIQRLLLRAGALTCEECEELRLKTSRTVVRLARPSES